MPREHRTSGTTDRNRKISRYVFFGFVAVAAYFVIAEHRAHVVPYLPFVLLAACPLLHLFMHGGHKHGGNDESDSQSHPPSSTGGTHQR